MLKKTPAVIKDPMPTENDEDNNKSLLTKYDKIFNKAKMPRIDIREIIVL